MSHSQTTHLDQRVYHPHVGTGIEHLVEASLSVDQLQLVELLVVLRERKGIDWNICPGNYHTMVVPQSQ